MLQPGMCSATSSESSTWIGPPGALATHSATDRRRPGRDVGAADPGVRAALQESDREVREPVRVGVARRRRCRRRSRRSRRAARRCGRSRALVLGADQAEPNSPAIARSRRWSRRRRRSPRSRIVEPRRPSAVADRGRAVVAQTTTETGGQSRSRGKRRLGERAPTVAAPASARGRASVSPKSQSSMSKPPRCHSSVHAKTNAPAQPRRTGAHLPGERSACACGAVAAAVEPELGHQQRPVAGDVLQAGEVGRDCESRLEVDVEADEVEEGQLEVLGRRVVDVGDERRRILVLRRAIEALDEALDPARGRASARSRRDLVADRVAEDRRDAGACADALADAPLDRPRRARRRGRRRAAPTGCRPSREAVLGGQVEQPARRHRVDADSVQSGRGHRGEVALHDLWAWTGRRSRRGGMSRR